MTYCAACGGSKNHEDMAGSITGNIIDYEKRYPLQGPKTLFFCKVCWPRMESQGLTQS